ncbi:MAG: MATE family efflux transporter [Bacilli bacterium]|nr:MATE family efflux transporter [Bacilli bacterium]
MPVSISEHFTFKKIARITIFPIMLMVFISLYSVVDGLFIANFANNDAFAAVNLIFPFIMIIGSIGFMLGTGGTALVSKYLGEKKIEKANKTFSMIIYTTIAFGFFFSVFGALMVKPVVLMMAHFSQDSTEAMIDYAVMYGQLMMLGQIAFMLQNVFHSFFMVAEKGKMGFLFTLLAGLTNIIFDALFIAVLKMGIIGAALGTILGYVVGGIGPLLYFVFKKNLPIRLGKTRLDFKDLFQAIYNGMSEFISNIAMNLVSVIYNAQLLRAYGVNGVSAYGVIMYLSFVFAAIFIGYSIGMAPPVGYNYGAQNKDELHNILKKSWTSMGVLGIAMFALSLSLAVPFAHLFGHGEQELINLIIQAAIIYSFAYLALGYSMFTSAFFTALNNGAVSTIISLCRTLIFQIGFAFLFPILFGDQSLWWALTAGELINVGLGTIFLILNRKKYGY